MEDEKRIVFNSSVQDINITNRLAHFQNSLFSKNYLDPNKKCAITPRQIYIDLNFKNPICPDNNSFPSFICCPVNHFHKKLASASPGDSGVKLEYFYNIHKYFLDMRKNTLFPNFTRNGVIKKCSL